MWFCKLNVISTQSEVSYLISREASENYNRQPAFLVCGLPKFNPTWAPKSCQVYSLSTESRLSPTNLGCPPPTKKKKKKRPK